VFTARALPAPKQGEATCENSGGDGCKDHVHMAEDATY